MTFNYYFGNTDINYYFSFHTLFSDDFKSLSVGAKALYALMLERANLSNKNHWFDEQNRVYIIYTAKNIMEYFQCSEHTALKLLKELDKFGLIERQYRKIGQSCLIYVKLIENTNNTNCDAQKVSESKKEQPAPALPEKTPDDSLPEKPERLNCANEQEYEEKRKAYLMAKMNMPSTSTPSEPPEKNTVVDCKNCSCQLQKMQSSNINFSSNNYIYHSYPYQSYLYNKKIDVADIEKINKTRNFIKKNIDYDVLIQEGYGINKDDLDNIVEIMTDVMTSKKPTIRIAGEERPTEVVKSVYSKIDMFDIQYVCECIDKNATKIQNIVAYMHTVLYKAKQTMHLYYTNLVRHDMVYNWK